MERYNTGSAEQEEANAIDEMGKRLDNVCCDDTYESVLNPEAELNDPIDPEADEDPNRISAKDARNDSDPKNHYPKLDPDVNRGESWAEGGEFVSPDPTHMAGV